MPGYNESKIAARAVESGCDSESYLVMVNGFPSLALGTVYDGRGKPMRFTEKDSWLFRKKMIRRDAVSSDGIELFVS